MTMETFHSAQYMVTRISDIDKHCKEIEKMRVSNDRICVRTYGTDTVTVKSNDFTKEIFDIVLGELATEKYELQKLLELL